MLLHTLRTQVSKVVRVLIVPHQVPFLLVVLVGVIQVEGVRLKVERQHGDWIEIRNAEAGRLAQESCSGTYDEV